MAVVDVTLAAANAAMDTPAIQFTGVSKRYGSQTAVHPIDLEIRDGEFFCLLGPSGCGKSTTLSLIGGFAAPSSGEIRISGELVNQTPPHRRKVNTVFQSYALFPHMNVSDNVAFGLKMAKVPRRECESRVAEALSLVALEPYADRYPGQLSGGQQQRVAVARALVNRPAVLLLDEPLGALDLQLRKRLQVELSQIQREVGTTFVFVTHDQGEAMAMADRIAVMNEGRIEQIGTAEEIYRRPARGSWRTSSASRTSPRSSSSTASVVTVRDRIPLPAPRHPDSGTGTLMVRPNVSDSHRLPLVIQAWWHGGQGVVSRERHESERALPGRRRPDHRRHPERAEHEQSRELTCSTEVGRQGHGVPRGTAG